MLGAEGWQSCRHMKRVCVWGVCVCVCVWGGGVEVYMHAWVDRPEGSDQHATGAEINSRLHHKSAPGPPSSANTCSTEIWIVEPDPHDICSRTHTRSLACSFTRIPPSAGKQQTARPLRNVRKKWNLSRRERRGHGEFICRPSLQTKHSESREHFICSQSTEGSCNSRRTEGPVHLWGLRQQGRNHSQAARKKWDQKSGAALRNS